MGIGMYIIVIVAVIGGITLEVFTIRDRHSQCSQYLIYTNTIDSCLGGFAMDIFLEINVYLDCGVYMKFIRYVFCCTVYTNFHLSVTTQ